MSTDTQNKFDVLSEAIEAKNRLEILDYHLLRKSLVNEAHVMVDDNRDEYTLTYLYGTIHEDVSKGVKICSISCGEKGTKKLLIFPETIIIGRFNDKKNFVHVFGKEVNETAFLTTFIISDEAIGITGIDKDLEENYEKVLALSRLPEKKMNSIINQINSGIYAEESSKVYFNTERELQMKYELCQMTYTPEQRSIIEDLFNSNHKKRLTKLKFILNISPTYEHKKEVNYDDLMDQLNKNLYKMDKVKEHLCDYLVSRNVSKSDGLKLLLVGNPGTGKTSIAKEIAKAYNLPYSILHMGNMSSTLELKGDDSAFDSSSPGILIDSFYSMTTTEGVLVLDEIDKMGLDIKNGNPYSALLDVLSENLCFDQFLEYPISTKNTIIIATANSIDDLPSHFIDKFEVIKVDDYNDEDKLYIAQNMLIPKILEDYPDDFKELIEFEDDAIRAIINNYCEDLGLRSLNNHLDTIVRSINSKLQKQEIKEKVIVNIDVINKELKNVVNKDSSVIRYKQNKEKYSKQVRELIESLIIRRLNPNISNSDKDQINKQLEYLTKIIPNDNVDTKFNLDKFNEIVNKTHYGMEDVKRSIAETFYYNSKSKKSISDEKFLLLGDPGTGKSTIIESIGKALDLPVIKIALNGVSEESFINGVNKTYGNADAGIIVRELARIGQTQSIIWLEELDKINYSHGNISNVFLDLLDDSKTFIDNFLGVPIDVSNVLFIATANSLATVDPILFDRFSLISLDGYSAQEKIMIAKNYLIPQLKEQLENDIVIDDETLEYLTINYCNLTGVRDLRKALSKLVKKELFSNRGKDQIIITKDCIDNNLDNIYSELGNFPMGQKIGLARGLGVANNRGFSLAVETILLPESDGIRVTGLPKESTAESVRIALDYILSRYVDNLKNKGIHLHFSEGSIEKDGTSAGVAILVSLFSAIYKLEVNPLFAYTGEIDLFGRIFKIGGVIPKIQGAIVAGCEKVFIPTYNFNEIKKEDLDYFSKKIEIIPVDHIDEVFSVVFPQADRFLLRKKVI